MDQIFLCSPKPNELFSNAFLQVGGPQDWVVLLEGGSDQLMSLEISTRTRLAKVWMCLRMDSSDVSNDQSDTDPAVHVTRPCIARQAWPSTAVEPAEGLAVEAAEDLGGGSARGAGIGTEEVARQPAAGSGNRARRKDADARRRVETFTRDCKEIEGSLTRMS